MEDPRSGREGDPRPEKVAVVDEVRQRLADSEAALLTEYRGINVTDMQALRRSLSAAGGDYKIYKNTLVRFAAQSLGLEIDELLTGPTAIAFVPTDGPGDPVAVAKVLRDFAKGNPNLVIKGGLLGTRPLSVGDAEALADIAPREELLARLAGLIAAPMQQFAGLLQALPQNFAYALQALIDEQGGAPAPEAEAPAPEADADVPSAEAAAPDAAADEPVDDEPAAADADTETEAGATTVAEADEPAPTDSESAEADAPTETEES
jgi:large subunit ribosomal protein L10